MIASLRTAPAPFSRPLGIVRSCQPSNLWPDTIAGLPPQTGHYAAIVLPIVAALWGSPSQVQSTPRPLPQPAVLLPRMHSIDYCDISGIRMLERVVPLYRAQWRRVPGASYRVAVGCVSIAADGY